MPKTYTFELAFSLPDKDDASRQPHMQIRLKYWAAEENAILLCTKLPSLRELEREISRLKRELDIVYAQAKRNFAGIEKRAARRRDQRRLLGGLLKNKNRC